MFSEVLKERSFKLKKV